MLAPIAMRELLVASRRPLSWRVRLGMTAAAILICFVALTGGSSTSTAGQQAFQVLGILALIYSLGAGFVFTAGCIFEERRDGTFGLLYLTPLSAWDVICGKLTSSSLQGIFGLVALFPVLFLPLLAGGVTGKELTRVILVLLVTIIFSLGAGIFASASARTARGALGLTAMLVIFPLACGWMGVLFVTVLSSASEQERKKRATLYWFAAYAVLVFFQLCMVAFSGFALIGSPGLAFWAASNPGTTQLEFLSSVAAIAATAVFYLLSATLSTEWYRAAREIAVEKEETEHIDDAIFPGLRSLQRVGDDPAGWLLMFLQSPPLLFYFMFAVILLADLGSGHSPTGFGMHYGFVVLGTIPYLIFNYSLARFCASPFAMLQRSGFMEALLSTPLTLAGLVCAQRKILWRTLKLPLIFLVISSIPGAIYNGAEANLQRMNSSGPLTLYVIDWGIGWLILSLQFETLGMAAMLQGIRGRKPLSAALRAAGAVIVPGLITVLFLPHFWNVRFSATGGIHTFLVMQFVQHSCVAVYLALLLWRTKVQLGLHPNMNPYRGTLRNLRRTDRLVPSSS